MAKAKSKSKSSKVSKASKAGPGGLLGLCGVLELERMLEGLTIDLTPIIVVRVPDVCGP